MTTEEKNHEAYMDVLECLDPSFPYDDEYMQSYNFWRPLQNHPFDEY